MGYTTEFEGQLTIAPELTTSQLAHLNSILGEEVSDHEEWEKEYPFLKDEYTNYIALELTKDFKGIKWNGGEKFYGSVGAVNVIILEMRKVCPEFALSGKLQASGEDFDDRWFLVIGKDGLAEKENIVRNSDKIRCPHCEEAFYVEDAEKLS